MRYGHVVCEFVAEGWSSGPVAEATSFWSRWRGVRGAPRGVGVLIRGWSVHGVGLKESLHVVALDRQDRVLMVGRLDPGRMVSCWGAARMLELTISSATPPIGTSLLRLPIVR
jgi:hypothetical protein